MTVAMPLMLVVMKEASPGSALIHRLTKACQSPLVILLLLLPLTWGSCMSEPRRAAVTI